MGAIALLSYLAGNVVGKDQAPEMAAAVFEREETLRRFDAGFLAALSADPTHREMVCDQIVEGARDLLAFEAADEQRR